MRFLAINPAFALTHFMRSATLDILDLAAALSGAAVIWSVLWILWGRYRFKILERSLA
ncbi:MAG: hypothetical protein R3B54_13345 [Bdellovibrionota bacterium]